VKGMSNGAGMRSFPGADIKLENKNRINVAVSKHAVIIVGLSGSIE
jgi:hypothetical protein